jgi:RHS repeat-associated protein
MLDEAGEMEYEQRYLPYGQPRLDASGNPIDFGYTGQRESDTGLMDYNARWFNAGIGMMGSPDPTIPGVFNPQALNRYAYVVGNPLRYVDPAGYRFVDASTGFYFDPHPEPPLGGNVDGGSGINSGGTSGSVSREVSLPSFSTGIGKLPPNRGSTRSGSEGPYQNMNPPVQPDPDYMDPQFPTNPFNYCPPEYTYTQCFYAGNLLTELDGEIDVIYVDWGQFVEMEIAIYFDLVNRSPVGGYDLLRGGYDTPFWDNGPYLDAQVCFEDGSCYERHEVNYIAQGMWSAAAGQSIEEGHAIVWLWKAIGIGRDTLGNVLRGEEGAEYALPTEAEYFWHDVGYQTYNIFSENHESLVDRYDNP